MGFRILPPKRTGKRGTILGSVQIHLLTQEVNLPLQIMRDFCRAEIVAGKAVSEVAAFEDEVEEGVKGV